MKKVFLNLLVAGFVSVFAVGCSKSMPECGDSEVTNVLDQIIKKQLLPRLGVSPAEINNIKAVFSDFMLDSKNENSKKIVCKAKIKLSYPGEKDYEEFIKYSAQYTEDGKQVYVEILQ